MSAATELLMVLAIRARKALEQESLHVGPEKAHPTMMELQHLNRLIASFSHDRDRELRNTPALWQIADRDAMTRELETVKRQLNDTAKELERQKEIVAKQDKGYAELSTRYENQKKWLESMALRAHRFITWVETEDPDERPEFGIDIIRGLASIHRPTQEG